MPKKKSALPPSDKHSHKAADSTSEVPPAAPKAGDWIGSMKGTMKIVGDIVSPASDENEWEVLRD